MPFGAIGLQNEVAEVLRASVQRSVIVTFELDVHLGRSAAARNKDGKAGASEVAAISVWARLARCCKVAPQKNFTAGEEIIVEDKSRRSQKKWLLGGFAVGNDVHGEEILTWFDDGAVVRRG